MGYGAVQKPEIPRQSTGQDRKCASCREISCMRMACCISESLTVPVPPFSNHNHHPNDTIWRARGHNNQRQRQRFASLLWIAEDWGAASESSFYFFPSFFYLDFLQRHGLRSKGQRYQVVFMDLGHVAVTSESGFELCLKFPFCGHFSTRPRLRRRKGRCRCDCLDELHRRMPPDSLPVGRNCERRHRQLAALELALNPSGHPQLR